MKLAEVEGRIERFIREEFAVSPSDPGFSRDADLFEGGYIDSVGIMELVSFLEREFDAEVPEDDLLSEDFSRIEGIARIIERQLARAQESKLWAS